MEEIIIPKILDCKKVETAINRAEKHLIAEAKKYGIYENIGQTYVRAILHKFLYSKGDDFQSQMKVIDLVQQFAHRMSTLSLTELQSA